MPDGKWYVVRNSIFVLGLLQDNEALVSLRLRLNDKDARVRREIISTLEKISGEEAVDLLGLMADDSERENAEAAVIAIGLIGTEEAIPLLKHIVRRNPSVALRFIYALGKIGGDDARDLLVQLLHADNALTDLAAGKFSKDELRVAIIKALGAIGDSTSLDALKDFQKNLSVAQKLLFKNSPVQKTINEVLAKR
jgi:HEAT repeat protein